MQFADLALAQRLEGAEGYACAQFAEARRRLVPGRGSEIMRRAGAYVVYDGADSPVTQTFGLGIYEELASGALAEIESFFHDRGAPVHHEVCPFAGVAVLDLLCRRGYRPVELSNVLYRAIEAGGAETVSGVRTVGLEEAQVWAEVSARGWSDEHPEFFDFIRDSAAMACARTGSVCFLAESEGRAAAAGVICIHEGVALFGGAATIPEFRRRGLQSALLEARMRYAQEHGCDLAMMVAEPGSKSQRNAERKGFAIAYTRTKWERRTATEPRPTLTEPRP